jgi:TatD DNase family protein
MKLNSEVEVMKWTDAHCHLEYARGPGSGLGSETSSTPQSHAVNLGALLAEVEAAAGAGVARLVDVGTDEARSRLALQHAAISDSVWATIGLHPHDATDGWEWIEPILQSTEADRLSGLTRLVGVGECGLDYHYDHSPRDIQRESFAAQIQLAHRYNLALVIHTREAWPETFAMLRSEGVPARTVFHCFTGGPAEAEECLSLGDGVMLSFSGIVSYKSAPENREAAVLCPLNRFTVETDSPYLTPVPHRGKRNVPGYVPLVGAAVAAAKDISVEEVALATWHNAATLFGLPQ